MVVAETVARDHGAVMKVLLIVVLSALDGYLTIYGGGIEIEGNPVMRGALPHIKWFYAYKVGGVAIFAAVLQRYAPRVLWCLIGVFASIFSIHAIVLSWSTAPMLLEWSAALVDHLF